MELAAFVARYPEFEQEDAATVKLVRLCVAEATARVSATRFGVRADEAVAAMAGDLLWSGAFGMPLRLDGSSENNYRKQYLRILRELGPAAFVS